MKKRKSNLSSLGDIARAAGVSKATTCYVLRNRAGPSAKTREHVLSVARELGYRPDPRVASWMACVRNTKTKELLPIAWLNTNPEKNAWEKYKFFTPYLEGALERARQLGYRLEKIWAAEPGMTMRRVSEIIHQRGIEGVVITQEARHMRLNWDYISAVALENSLLAPCLDHVHTDNYFNLMLALKMVRRFGYRRIGVCLQDLMDRHSQHSCRAATTYFHQTITKTERIAPFFYARENDEILAEREKTVVAWLHRVRPDVVVGHSNHLLGWVEAAGYRVPKDLGVVHLATDDDVPEWAGIHSKRWEIGAAAVERVISQLHNRQFGIPKTAVDLMIRGTWHGGRTLLVPKPEQ